MRHKSLRLAAVIVASLALLSCSDATGPHRDVDVARQAWLATRPPAYGFEIETARSMFPKSGYYLVEVINGQVVAASDSDGKAVEFSLTIESIWDQVLAARAKGELNSALFDDRGIPVESDMGPWPVDGGVHYSVRNFSGSR